MLVLHPSFPLARHSHHSHVGPRVYHDTTNRRSTRLRDNTVQTALEEALASYNVGPAAADKIHTSTPRTGHRNDGHSQWYMHAHNAPGRGADRYYDSDDCHGDAIDTVMELMASGPRSRPSRRYDDPRAEWCSQTERAEAHPHGPRCCRRHGAYHDPGHPGRTINLDRDYVEHSGSKFHGLNIPGLIRLAVADRAPAHSSTGTRNLHATGRHDPSHDNVALRDEQMTARAVALERQEADHQRRVEAFEQQMVAIKKQALALDETRRNLADRERMLATREASVVASERTVREKADNVQAQEAEVARRVSAVRAKEAEVDARILAVRHEDTRNKASVMIQRRWRRYIDTRSDVAMRQGLRVLKHLHTELNNLLDMHDIVISDSDDSGAATASVSGIDTKATAHVSETLTKQLETADAIVSHGNVDIRRLRKDHVRRVLRILYAIENPVHIDLIVPTLSGDSDSEADTPPHSGLELEQQAPTNSEPESESEDSEIVSVRDYELQDVVNYDDASGVGTQSEPGCSLEADEEYYVNEEPISDTVDKRSESDHDEASGTDSKSDFDAAVETAQRVVPEAASTSLSDETANEPGADESDRSKSEAGTVDVVSDSDSDIGGDSESLVLDFVEVLPSDFESLNQ